MRWSDEGFWDPSLAAAARPSDHLIYEDYLASSLSCVQGRHRGKPEKP